LIIAEQNYLDLAWLILASIIASFLITPFSIWVAKKADIIDYPDRSSHSIHKNPVPRAGGIAIILSLLIIITVKGIWAVADIRNILIPAVIIFFLGLWDDKEGMNAPTKFLGQVIATTILVIFDIRVMFLEKPDFFIQFDPGIAYGLDLLITYFWIIGITNAVNMIDSMDGLAIGICQIISAFFMLLLMVSNQPYLSNLAAILFGISWGFSFHNKQPAKTFLGDSGAQTMGFILAALAIQYHPIAYSQASSWFAPILFFSVPIFDTTLVTLSRLLRGTPFYKANLDHTYHRLIKMGWIPTRAVSVLHLCEIVFSLIAVCSMYLSPTKANIIFFVWLLSFAILLYWLEKKFREN
jgi:UDP-GlcNAc:undecaprenyl-phosphate GlcNAc-1-phosphate transferase